MSEANRRFISFKYPEEIQELTVMHPFILMIIADLSAFCWMQGYPAPVITCLGRTDEENHREHSVSETHPELRAFDLRSEVYTEVQHAAIVKHLQQKFNQWAAVGPDGQPRLVVYHKTDIGSFHFHVQLHSKFALPKFVGMNA
jgi:hypothetical protein